MNFISEFYDENKIQISKIIICLSLMYISFCFYYFVSIFSRIVIVQFKLIVSLVRNLNLFKFKISVC